MKSYQIITHIFPEPSRKNWFELSFLTKKLTWFGFRTSKNYYMDGDPTQVAKSEDVEADTTDGALKKLDKALLFKEDKGLFLSPDGEIWLASTKNPVKDTGRKQIFISSWKGSKKT